MHPTPQEVPERMSSDELSSLLALSIPATEITGPIAGQFSCQLTIHTTDNHRTSARDFGAILQEVLLANDELHQMLAVDGPMRAMWGTPRKYFSPEPGTDLPFPSPHLADLVWPATSWTTEASEIVFEDPLAEEILIYWEYFDLVRREIIPDKYSR